MHSVCVASSVSLPIHGLQHKFWVETAWETCLCLVVGRNSFLSWLLSPVVGHLCKAWPRQCLQLVVLGECLCTICTAWLHCCKFCALFPWPPLPSAASSSVLNKPLEIHHGVLLRCRVGQVTWVLLRFFSCLGVGHPCPGASALLLEMQWFTWASYTVGFVHLQDSAPSRFLGW